MKTAEELRYAALTRAKDFLEIPGNVSQLNTIAEYPALKLLLDDGIKKVFNARALNMENITSYAAAKQETQTFLVDLVFTYLLRGAVKAHEENQFELEAALSFPKSYITHNDDEGVGVKCKEITNRISDNLAILTNILPADIVQMQDAILAYDEILAAPKEAIDKRKAYGTGRINTLLNEADIPKINIGKLVHSYFPEMTIGWDQAITVGKSSGVRHTSVAIQFNVAGTELKLENVKCTITNGSETHTCLSSALGWVRFYSLTTDIWTATCQLETFETFVLSGIEADDNHLEKHFVPLRKIYMDGGSGDPTTTGILSLIIFDLSTNQPMPGVVVSIPALDYEATTNEVGEAHKEGIPPRNYQGTLFFPGYLLMEFSFLIEAGKTCTMQLNMEKQTP